MKTRVFCLILMVLLFKPSTTYSMDEQSIQAQNTPLLQLPAEVIARICYFISESSFADVIKLGSVCKYLRSCVSKGKFIEDQDLLNDKLAGAIDAACYSKIGVLIHWGAKYNNLNTLLTYTVNTQDDSNVTMLLDLGIEPTQTDLWTAVIRNDISLAKRLLAKDVLPNVQMLKYVLDKGENPEQLAQILIDYGVNVNETVLGESLLSYARTSEMARLLIKNKVQGHWVEAAVISKDPRILADILRQKYPVQTVVVIALLLRIATPYISHWCAIV